MTSKAQHRKYGNLISRMRPRAATLALAVAGMLAQGMLSAPAAQAQTFTILYTFTGGADGNDPAATSAGSGVVFKLDPTGNETVLTFTGGADGAYPVSGKSVPLGLAQDSISFKTLYSFTGQLDGGDPEAGMVAGNKGALYGTTNSGGTSNAGTVFEMTPPAAPGRAWTERVLHDFEGGSDGANPQAAGVVMGSGGVLYGMTSGTVFSLAPPTSLGGSWTETVLWSFSADGSPTTGVEVGSGGVLYGTFHTNATGGPELGCPSYGCGIVFSLVPPVSPGDSWTETNLLAIGNYLAGLMIGSGGVLYFNGANTESYPQYFDLWSLTPPTSPGSPWASQVLYSTEYGSEAHPEAALVIGSGGVIYGTIQNATSNLGTVYSLAPPASPGGAWTETVLWSFTGGNDGADPVGGLTIGTNGVLYGTTSSGGASNVGTVFSLAPPASPGGPWTETVLHNFKGGDDGADPVAGLVIGENGVLYGTTSAGGTSNAGTVFALKP